ncbi:MAG TPA: hypothetical protein VFW03_11235 [Gemmatimonadaceae bacterium]|nr:hypothetical protein [Gemmatimonadaceae bacterium]
MRARSSRSRVWLAMVATSAACSASSLLAQDTQDNLKDKLIFVPIRASQVMSAADQQRIGIDRLTPEQRFALDAWLTRYSAELRANAFRQPAAPASRSIAASSTEESAPTESANAPEQSGHRGGWGRSPLSTIPPAARLVSTPDDGSFVRLADGTLWEVYVPDRTFTDEWQEGDYITVSLASTALGDFDHVLVDTNANTRAHVRFVDVVGSRRR